MEIVGAFLVIPSKGEERIMIKDMNENGLSFYTVSGQKYSEGDMLQVYFHVTEKIKLPLSLKIAYAKRDSRGIKIGCETVGDSTPAMTAFKEFARFIHSLGNIY